MIRRRRWEAAGIQFGNALNTSAEGSTVRPALVEAVRQLKKNGQTMKARDLCLAFLAKYPHDEEVTFLWGRLADSGEAKSIVALQAARPRNYRVSAIVSTYKSEEFIGECLENLLAQSIADDIEIVILDAASPQKERAIVQTYQKRFDNIAYIRTHARVGVYTAWNIAIAHAGGQYCISVSTNDQLRRNACELLARELDTRPDTVLVFGDTYLTRNPHETFDDNHHHAAYRWGEYVFEKHLSKGCCVGPHPMWRRCVHAAVGYFDERFVADGDQEFWMRLGSQYPVKHIPELTGLQWITPESLSGRGNTPLLEVAYIQAVYRRLFPAGDKKHRQPCRALQEHQSACSPGAPLISAIVSTYNAEAFIGGCLEDLLAQTIARRMEIIVVDSGSEEDEAGIVKAWQQKHGNIRYIRTDHRECVYAAWNRGIKIARGKYITNANTDDRHRRDALEKMTAVMESRPEIDLVYADLVKTQTPHQTFDTSTPTGMLRWPDWSRQQLLSQGCFIGPQPVWRRKVHDRYGFFDEAYSVSADYEFWLRISQTSTFYHLPETLGLYLERDDSVEHVDPRRKRCEDMAINRKYRSAGRQGRLIGLQPNAALKTEAPLRLAETRIEEETPSPGEMASASQRQIQTRANQGGFTMHSPETILNAIHLLISAEHKEAACWALDKMLADHPDNAYAHNNRAMLAYDRGDMDMALTHFERAAALAPDKAAFQKDLGDFYYAAQQRTEPALAQYDKALALKPDDEDILIAAGHLCVSLQRFDQARRHYERAVTVAPGRTDVEQMLEKLNRQISQPAACESEEDLYARATAKASAGDHQGAVAALEQLIARNGEHALAHNDLGVLNYKLGQMDKALHHYQKAVAAMPQSIVFNKNLGDFYGVEKNDLQAAMERYVQVLKLAPDDVETLLSCAQICMALKKNDDARAFLDTILLNEPWNDNAAQMLKQLDAPASGAPASRDDRDLYQQAREKTANGDLAGAIAALNQLIGQSPQNAMAHNDLGVLNYRAGNHDRALQCYQTAVRLSPDDPTYQKNLADFYLLEQGQAEDALKLYVKVLEQNPRDVDCLLATGLVCASLKDFPEARSFYRRALEIEPQNANAHQALEQLDQAEGLPETLPETATDQGTSKLAMG